MAESVIVASGKGGVGKSTFAAGLGAVLAHRGRRVVVVDLDIGLRSQDALLGLSDRVVYDLMDAQSGDCTLDQAVIPCASPASLCLLPAAQFARAKALHPSKLREIINQLKESFDYVLLDCPAGIERGLRNALNAGADRAVLVTTPDDVSLRDAERAFQVMEAKGLPRPFLVVNRLDDRLIRRGEMISAAAAAQLLDLPLLGEIPDDPAVGRSLLRRRLFTDFVCEARSAMLRVASRFEGAAVPFPDYGRRRVPLFSRALSARMREVVPGDGV